LSVVCTSCVCEQLSCEDVFFTSAVNICCQTLPNIKALLSLRDGLWFYFLILLHWINQHFINENICNTENMNVMKCSGQPSVLNDDSGENIHESLLWFPWKSVRKFALQSGLWCGSLHKAVKILKILKFHPCMHIIYELKDPDKRKRLWYCQWFWNLIQNGVAALDNVHSFFREGLVSHQWLY
jgi:hypothetical protein